MDRVGKGLVPSLKNKADYIDASAAVGARLDGSDGVGDDPCSESPTTLPSGGPSTDRPSADRAASRRSTSSFTT